jgi:hypothetical protein
MGVIRGRGLRGTGAPLEFLEAPQRFFGQINLQTAIVNIILLILSLQQCKNYYVS